MNKNNHTYPPCTPKFWLYPKLFLYQAAFFLGLFLFSTSLCAQVKLWGLVPEGGAFENGVISSVNTDGSSNETFSFPKNIGGNPQFSNLIESSNGKFYGMARLEGNSNKGVIFEYDLSNNGYIVLHHFDGANGGEPYGSLIESNGKFYGMTRYGGSSNNGVIFEFNPTGGVYTVLHHFDGTTGRQPHGDLLEWSGKFYGMTRWGGASNYGVVFEYDPSGAGSLTVLHDFNVDGRSPYGNLIESGGKFYGMTESGGNSSNGVFFEIDPSGSGYTYLHRFDRTDGSGPQGNVIEFNGKFYGMTRDGGSGVDEYGVIFEYDPSGSGFSVLYEFDGTNGATPLANLTESGGKFYGTTSNGGSNNIGVLFEYDPVADSYVMLHEFVEPEGKFPISSLLISGGKFYGMTSSGGSVNDGVLYEYDPSGGGFSAKLHFGESTSGNYPIGTLIESSGKLYGMANGGGSFDAGVIYEYDPSVLGLIVLHNFDDANGSYPAGGLLESAGKFFGMTPDGGTDGYGVVFEFDPSVGFTVLHHFDGDDGEAPNGNLIEFNGKFFGMTSEGGDDGYGVLFEYDPSGGGYSIVQHFEGDFGESPFGSLLEFNGKLYGMTTEGGYDGYGVVFEYDPAGGGLTVLHDFDEDDGAFPFGSLITYNGKLYGMTSDGGTSYAGTIFEYDPIAGVHTVLYHFNNDDYPIGSLIESGGKFYGMTNSAGTSGSGIVFEYDPVGAGYTIILNYDGMNGAYPDFGSLLAVGSNPCTPVQEICNGIDDDCDGIIDNNILMINFTVNDVNCKGASTGFARARVSGGTYFTPFPLNKRYQYTWSTGETLGRINMVPKGTYTVTVTEAGGCVDSAMVVIEEADVLGVALSSAPNGADFDLTVTASDGTPPYTRYWRSGTGGGWQTPNVFLVPAGLYIVKAQDNAGCQKSRFASVPVSMMRPSLYIDEGAADAMIAKGGPTEKDYQRALQRAIQEGEVQLEGLSLWPNPATDYVHIAFSEKTAIQSIQIMNTYGQVVRTILAPDIQGQQTLRISTEGLVRGSYCLKASSEAGVVQTKCFVVVR